MHSIPVAIHSPSGHKELKEMVDANNYFGGSYLKASDIRATTNLTIKEAKVEKLDDREKIVVYFDETDKGLVLNKINTSRITKQLGTSETEEWPANKITLIATEVEYDGKDVPCIRVQKQEELATPPVKQQGPQPAEQKKDETAANPKTSETVLKAIEAAV